MPLNFDQFLINQSILRNLSNQRPDLMEKKGIYFELVVNIQIECFNVQSKKLRFIFKILFVVQKWSGKPPELRRYLSKILKKKKNTKSSGTLPIIPQTLKFSINLFGFHLKLMNFLQKLSKYSEINLYLFPLVIKISRKTARN